MTEKIGLLFSGQGAQAVGMGRELAAHSPAAAELFQRADAVLGRPLSTLAFEGPLETLTLTANCQPALFVHGLATLAALRAETGDFPVTRRRRSLPRRMDRARLRRGRFLLKRA